MDTRETITMPPHGPADTPRRDESPTPRVLFCRGADGLSLYDIGPDNTATLLCTICDIGPTADKHRAAYAKRINAAPTSNSCKITRSTKQATHERVQT